MVEKYHDLLNEDFENLFQISSENFLKIEYINISSGVRHSIIPNDCFNFHEDGIFAEDANKYAHFTDSCRISQALSPTHKTEALEIRYIADDGTMLYLSAKTTALSFTGRHLTAYMLTIENITDNVLKNKQLFRELSDSFQKAVKANAAKNEFLLRISHDIRTPVNAIIGMVTLAKRSLLSDVQIVNYLDNIESAAHLLVEMFNETLSMSMIESGKLDLHEELLDLRACIDELAVLTYTNVSEKHHNLTIDISDIKSFYVYADKIRLSQCLLNFISNSVKYTPKGGTINFSVKEMPNEVSGISDFIFTVEDNGFGISPGFLKHISEPFTRDDTVEKAGIRGTGLGMSISYKIIAAMNGTVEVESTLGVGTVFTIKLPLKIADERTLSSTPSSKAAAHQADIFSSYNFSGLNFLIADDDELNLEILCDLLDLTGANIETASNGKIAVEKFTAAPVGYYDLIILDIRMPVLDGYETARLIRAAEPRASTQVPIVALTADTISGSAIEVKDSNIQKYITKPLNTEHLFYTISQVLEHKELS